MGQILYGFFAGTVGGIIAFILAVAAESILSGLGKPTLPINQDPVSLAALLVPVFLEEFAKTAVAKRIFNRWVALDQSWLGKSIWVILGTGIGFGLAETYFAQSGIPLKISSGLLPLVHSIFLIFGYFIAKYLLVKEDKQLYSRWLLAAVLLHWAYNISRVIFFA